MDQIVTNMILDAHKEMRSDLRAMDNKIDEILEWKWRMIGGTIVVSGLLTIMFQIGLALVQRQ